MSIPSHNKPHGRLAVCPQNKGGIGKSITMVGLVDWCRVRHRPFVAFDLDHANSTFKRFIPEARFLRTDNDSRQLDEMVRALDGQNLILVDNRATGGERFTSWLHETGILNLKSELGFRLTMILIAVEDKDALSQAAQLVEEFADRVDWLLVRNARDGASMPMYENSRFRARVLQELHGVEAELPLLHRSVMGVLQKHNLTPQAGTTSEHVFLLDRQRCLNFCRAWFAALDQAKEVLQ